MKNNPFKWLIEAFQSFNIWGSPIEVKIKSIEEGRAEDREALRKDWEAVGNDIRNAMKQIDDQMF